MFFLLIVFHNFLKARAGEIGLSLQDLAHCFRRSKDELLLLKFLKFENAFKQMVDFLSFAVKFK